MLDMNFDLADTDTAAKVKSSLGLRLGSIPTVPC